jgi:hypothetical protein
MAQSKTNQKEKTNNGAVVEYEQQRWHIPDGLRTEWPRPTTSMSFSV